MNFIQAKPDKTGATYRHTIEYGTRSPEIGYSKKLGFNEPADKRLQLVGIIERLFLPSLEKGAYCFKIAKRNFQADSTYRETPVIELYEDGWQLFGTFKNDTMLEKFLQVLFETQNTNAAKAVFIGYNSMTFTGTTQMELIEQCQALKNYEPADKVKRFYNHLCKAKGWDIMPGQQPTANSNQVSMKPIKDTVYIGALVENHLRA